MKLGLLGALIGGAIGAVVWALIARFLHIELGYVAWGVGFAVGFVSAAVGGSGIANGITCALICLVSIFAGKTLAVHWSLTPEEIRSGIAGTSEFSALPPGKVDEVVEAVRNEWTLNDSMLAAKEDLGAMDLLFAGLGVMTAFSLGRQSNAPGSEAPQYVPGSYDPIPDRVEPEQPDGEPETGGAEPKP